MKPEPLLALVLVLAAPAIAPAGAQAQEPDVPATPPEWQQEVAYTMEARLDEDEQRLEAAQTVRYRNASPDTLDRLYFHLYLNAFRPHSVWARNEKREEFPFDELEDPDYGYERLRDVRLLSGPGAEEMGVPPAEGGVELTPSYPHAPDSTVARLDLPEPLPPGGEVVLRMRWDARPATLCRRQCRKGRSWDFAQWYPRVAVYDQGGWQAHPLYPQGEFYGEFATYDVMLDLARDQVVGATGVPVEGDPGWDPAEGSPAESPAYQRNAYDRASLDLARPAPGLLDGEPDAGRRRVRFRATNVHHFAWSTSPEYRYEGDVYERGELPDVAIHVLYRPGDSTWDDGVAVERTIRALSWLESVFRPYPYPQLTNLHRIEGGGTEFPMVIMNGSASEGLIVHESTHQYAHGILANNEWKEAWLDEGLTSFLDTWYAEEHGERPWDGFMERIGRLLGALTSDSIRASPPNQLQGLAVEGDTLPTPRPVATRSEAFANYAQYGLMSYSKPQAVFYMLRQMVGKETVRRILRTYYDRYEFRHVNEAALRGVAEDVSGRDLDWFFDQWLHGTGVLDYAVGDVRVEETGDGRWRVRAEVVRQGRNWMPVTVEAGDARTTARARADTTTVTLVASQRPEAVVVDPEREVLDVDRSDNRKEVR